MRPDLGRWVERGRERGACLTGRGELVGKVFDEFIAGHVGDGSEEDDRADESRMAEDDPLVGRELAERLGKHHIVPVILQGSKMDEKWMKNG